MGDSIETTAPESKHLTKKLTERQIRFSQEYIIDLNGEKAAIRAGYAEGSAAESACQSLMKSNVQEYIQELLDDRAARTQATADKVVSEIYHLISFDAAEIFDEAGRLKDIHSIPKDTRKAIASIEIEEEFEGQGSKRIQTGFIKKIKFWDKTKAIELLAKHLRLLIDGPVINNTNINKVESNVNGNTHFTGEDAEFQNRILADLSTILKV